LGALIIANTTGAGTAMRPKGATTTEPTIDDAIARSKRVLSLIDIYLNKPSSDARAAIRTTLMSEFEQADFARAAAAKAQASMLQSLRDQAALHRMALVPFRMTRAMNDVVNTEDWDWPDLLAAAEAVAENDHGLAGMSTTLLLENAVDDFIEDYVLEQDGGAYVPTDQERVLVRDAVQGLLADPAFAAALAELAAEFARAPESPASCGDQLGEPAPTAR
jgi:hypothetical protein